MVRKQNTLFIIIIVVLLLVGLFILYMYFPQEEIDEDNEWNQPEVESPDYSFGALYNLTDVIKIDELLLNSTFIKQVENNLLIYLYGFSDDGRNMAYINYDKAAKGYKINIYDVLSMKDVFSIFIPKSDLIIESKEFLMAKDLLENVYKIDVPVQNLTWNENMMYGDKWYFSERSYQSDSYLSISNSNYDYWTILLEENYNHPTYIELFTLPDNPERVAFVFYYSNTINNISDFQIYTINLADLNINNSVDGKNVEADNWLYGDINFVYNQWDTRSRRGFFAISNSDADNNEAETTKKIEQWVYIDPTGLMQWHGNYDGIFNRKGELLVQIERGVYFRINLIEDGRNMESIYFVIDLYDSVNDELLKTIEFKWDEEVNGLIPLHINSDIEDNI